MKADPLRVARMRAAVAAGSPRPAELDPEERQILRYIELQGAVTGEIAERNGWTHRGLPQPPLARLVERGIVAPRCLTSWPVRISWELRAATRDPQTLDRIRREASRLRLRDYAPGGLVIGPGTDRVTGRR